MSLKLPLRELRRQPNRFVVATVVLTFLATLLLFLGGLLDHLLADQTLLLMFAEDEGVPPERIVRLRRQLPGASVDF